MIMRHRLIIFVGFVLAAIMLAACTVNINTQINDDGSGTWSTEFILNQQDKESLATLGTTVEEFCNESGADMPPGSAINIEDKGEETWCIISVPFANLSELRQMYAESDGIVVNRLEIVGDTFYYDVSVDATSSESDMGTGGLIGMNWKVTVPGKVGANNATSVDGNALTWDLTSNQVMNAQVQSSLGGGGIGGISWGTIAIALGAVCLCGLVIIIVVIVVFLVMRKRKASTPPE
jgi:hypothetical protein